MDFFSILTLIGGLAMFLYGMEVMGDGLKQLSGSKLETILSKLTSTRFKGFLLGLIVTSIIQSSSATTVMLVGFVNSGIMKLSQTISIIMGANIGTTVTAWLLSLSGINGDSFFIQLLKPSSFTPVLALIGILLNLAGKDDKRKDVGSILLGFSVLMFGMETMSGSMEGLKNSEQFAKMMLMFSNPVMGILVGLGLTAIIQSSSASVGILQALSMTGTINFATALPIILGANIGTTITPVISSINGNTDSKRVAAACVEIKLIGVVMAAGVFYLINVFKPFPFMNDRVGVAYIAIIHTVFNILSTIVLMPFSNQLAELAKKTVKRKTEKRQSEIFDTLDERFLSIPGFAVEKCREVVCEMADMSKNSFVESLGLMKNFDKKVAEKIHESEDTVDVYEDKTSTYLVHLAGSKLSDYDSREVTKLLHVVGDVERISDHAINVIDVAKEIHEKNIVFSEKAQKEIGTISAAVCEILELAMKALRDEDRAAAKNVEPLEQTIDKLKYDIKNNHIERLRDGQCTIEMGFVLSDFLTNCERVSDHCSNIAVCILEMAHNSLETHEYLSHVKNDGKNHFFEKYDEYRKKYKL